MAYMDRGSSPSGNNGSAHGNNSNNTSSDDDIGGYGYGWRTCYYVPLDNTYVLMQMVTTFIILIVGVITFLFTYKSNIIDPIENMKKMFINTYLLTIGVLLAITLIINFFSKNEKSLIRRLGIMLVISMVTMVLFIGIKLHWDKTYTKDKFDQFYTEQNVNEVYNDPNKTVIDVGISGVSLKTEKEYYINECSKLYSIFSTKVYGTLVIHILLNVLLIYQISRVSKIKGKKDQLNKDDVILFDKEQNVKI